MSIDSFLLTKENLELVGKSSWKFGRPQVIELGMRYYDDHPGDVTRIADNLSYMGLPSTGQDLDAVLIEIVVHYYEKIFALVKTYEAYWIAKNRVDVGDSMEPFIEARETGKAVFVGQSHFGATYLMYLMLMVHGFDINVVGNFPDPVGPMLIETNGIISQKYGTGSTRLLNMATPDVDVPFEMMRLLSTRNIVSNVFDENNEFCKPVTLLDRQVMGGTGMDVILRNYSDERVIVVTPFMIRTSDETFRYELDRHTLAGGDIIARLYKSLERRIQEHYHQWYFIHEVHESFVA